MWLDRGLRTELALPVVEHLCSLLIGNTIHPLVEITRLAHCLDTVPHMMTMPRRLDRASAVIMAALTVLGLVTSAAGFGWIALLGVFGWCTKRWQLTVPVVCR